MDVFTRPFKTNTYILISRGLVDTQAENNPSNKFHRTHHRAYLGAYTRTATI